MSIGELLTFFGIMIGLVAYLISSNVSTNIKITELRVRLTELESNTEKNEQLILETAKVLKETTIETAKLVEIAKEKIDDKLDEKINKINEKIDHIIEGVNEIKINCAGRLGICKLDNKGAKG